MDYNYYQWSNGGSTSWNQGEVDADTLAALQVQMNALSRQVQSVKFDLMQNQSLRCDWCGGVGHQRPQCYTYYHTHHGATPQQHIYNPQWMGDPYNAWSYQGGQQPSYYPPEYPTPPVDTYSSRESESMQRLEALLQESIDNNLASIRRMELQSHDTPQVQAPPQADYFSLPQVEDFESIEELLRREIARMSQPDIHEKQYTVDNGLTFEFPTEQWAENEMNPRASPEVTDRNQGCLTDVTWEDDETIQEDVPAETITELDGLDSKEDSEEDPLTFEVSAAPSSTSPEEVRSIEVSKEPEEELEIVEHCRADEALPTIPVPPPLPAESPFMDHTCESFPPYTDPYVAYMEGSKGPAPLLFLIGHLFGWHINLKSMARFIFIVPLCLMLLILQPYCRDNDGWRRLLKEKKLLLYDPP